VRNHQLNRPGLAFTHRQIPPKQIWTAFLGTATQCTIGDVFNRSYGSTHCVSRLESEQGLCLLVALSRYYLSHILLFYYRAPDKARATGSKDLTYKWQTSVLSGRRRSYSHLEGIQDTSCHGVTNTLFEGLKEIRIVFARPPEVSRTVFPTWNLPIYFFSAI